MQHPRATSFFALRVLALAALVATCGSVHADDYSDVGQLLRAGKLAEAQAKADQYLAAKPRDPQMRFLKGVIQTESGKPADAVNTFTALTQEYPELPEPYNNLAVLYAGQKQFDKARTALEMAIRTNPSYATAHENLGDVYAKLASQAYSKALQLDGGNAAVPPKLALIRELFAPAPASGAKVSVGAAAGRPASTLPASPPTVAPPAGPAVAVAKVPAPASVPVPTPAATAVPTPAPAPAAADSDAEKEVAAAVRAWAAAWAEKDMKDYLGAYAREFDAPGNQSRAAWEEERRARIVGKSRIVVGIQNLDVTVNGNKATARFRQDYNADTLKVSSRKTLEFLRVDKAWRIVRETTG